MSNIKHLEFSDSQLISETCSLVEGNKSPRIEVIGDVIIEDSLGAKTFGRNKFVINGSLLALEKLFNVKSRYAIKTINQLLAINPTVAIPTNPGGVKGPYFNDAIYLFSVGMGGSGTAFESVKEVKYNEVDVKNIVPFRYTKTPLSTIDEERYYLKKADGDYMSYYAKKFDADPVIKSLMKDGSEIPDNVESLTDDDIDTFIELKLTVNKTDCREWFAVKGSGIESARINTLSLLAGIPVQISEGNVDFINLKCMTKYNFKNEALENDKELYITYRIYI